MKASYQQLNLDTKTSSFWKYKVESERFGFHWHYHPELEICYVVEGSGNRLVGDNVSSFEAGDLVLLGSNLPHTWISSEAFHESGATMKVIVIQFTMDLFSPFFLRLPEMKAIQSVLHHAWRGLAFHGTTAEKGGQLLHKLCVSKDFESLSQLMTLLNLLGQSDEVEALASTIYTPHLSKSNENRISQVCQFIHQHYLRTIALEEVAQIANMTEAAFCRYFKKMTGQSFLDYVNDLRIGHACHLLMETHKTIAEIAYQSGYNSLTHFNRSFQKRKKTTPRQFRKPFYSRK